MKKFMSFKRVLAVLLVISMMVSFAPTAVFAVDSDSADVQTFTDVGTDHWAYGYVEEAVSLGLMSGVSETTFEPSTTMTRGMFVAVLSRLAGVTLDNDVETGFTDVPAGKYYTGAVAWAAELGITSGISDTLFAPDQEVTRQEAAAFLDRYAEIFGISLPDGEAVEFTDADDISTYAKASVDAMSAAGILSGYTDGTFLPKKALTRAEAASLFVRFYQYTVTESDETEYYSVSFATTHATVTVDGSETTFCAVQGGESLTFTVQADDGYNLTSVSGSTDAMTDNGDGSYTIDSISEDISIVVVAEANPTYTVSFETVDASAIVDGETVTYVVVSEGESLTFTAQSDDGYTIANVTASAGTLTENTDGTYTLSDITEDISIAISATETPVTPAEPEQYTITFVTDDGVTVFVDGVEAETATVSSDDLFFSFSYTLNEEHTQISSTTVSPAGQLNLAGSTYVLTGFTGDTTIMLTTGIETFQVRFNTGAESSEVETQSVAYMETAVEPEDPTCEGYYFGGWYSDNTLITEYDFSTPITEDVVLYACWLAPLDTVYLNGTTGSNLNDGGTDSTPVLTFGMAAKLVKYSTTKTIVITGRLTVEDTQVWDLSDVPDAIVIRGDSLTGYNSGMIYVSGTGNLTINNVHFDGLADRENNLGTTFLQLSYTALKDEEGNYTGEYVIGTAVLNNCEVENFGTIPSGTSGYDIFHNYCIMTYGNLYINGGSYHGNMTSGGGVIDQSTYSSVYIDGGEFYDNESRYHEATYAYGYGGVIYVGNQNLYVSNAVFHDNTAEYGGAIYTATMSGYTAEIVNCTFYNNSAVNGGAVYAKRIVSMDGGTFYDNESTNGGDGLYIDSSATVTLTTSEDSTLAFNDSYYSAASAGLYIGSSVAENEGTFTYETLAVISGKVLATGSDYTLTEADAAKFVVADSTATVAVNTTNNTIEIASDDTGGGDQGGGGDEDDEGTHDLSVVYLNGASGSDSNDGATASTAVATFSKAKGLLAEDGIIYITGQVTVSGSETWSLDPEEFGSAKVVRASTYLSGYMISVDGGALTLKDITIDGNGANSSKSAIYLNAAAITIGEGAVICNHTNTGSYGSAVYGATSGCTVIVNGGVITGNTASSTYSSAIYLASGGSFTMSSGEISDNTNTGSYSAAVYVGSSSTRKGTLNISGGVIQNNTSTGTYGAAVYGGSYCAINISGGEILNNTSYSAGISTSTYATVTLTGGKISGNTSTRSAGGGINTSSYATVYLYGGEISGNTSYSTGGGVNLGTGTTIVLDGTTITGNHATTNGGGIYTPTGLTAMTITSGTISGNTAGTAGNGVYVAKTEVVTVEPSDSGLEIADQIYINNTSSSSGDRVLLVGDLTNLTGKLLFNFANLHDGIVVAKPVEDYTFTSSDLAKFGCSGCNVSYSIDESGQIVVTTTAVEGITLDQETMSIMATYTADITATLTPADASNQKITWSSSNTSVATVSGTSLQATVTAKTPGTATITAKTADGSYTATCAVTVTENTTPITSITVDPESVKILGGTQTTITATVLPDNAYSTDVTWSTSDETIAAIETDGNTVTVTAGNNGTATITATADDGQTATCTVIVSDLNIEAISLSAESVTVKAGDTAPVGELTITPSNATNQNVTWTSSDPDVATVITSGINATVVGVNPGTATLTVVTEDGGYTASCTVTVTEGDTNNLSLDITNMNLIIFQTFNISALFETEVQDVTWTTSDSEIVSIESVSGNQVTVKAQTEGSVTITATAADGQKAICKVKVSGAVAGTYSNVYVDGYYGSDSNSGTSASSPVASYAKALSMLGVNGTLHITTRVNITSDTVISLPKEIYGDAKIVIESGSGFITSGSYNIYISDVTIDASGCTGQVLYMTSSGPDATAYISNNTYISGGTARLIYLVDGNVVMNGGTVDSLVGTNAYGIIRAIGGTFTMNGGTISNCTQSNYGGIFGISSGAVIINGGTFTNNGITSNTGGIFAVMSGTIEIYGGTFEGCFAKSDSSSLGYINAADGITIKPIYDLTLDGGIYLNGSAYSVTIDGRLDTIGGTLNIYASGNAKGSLLASGTDHQLTWADLEKVTTYNTSYSIKLDLENNLFILAQ